MSISQTEQKVNLYEMMTSRMQKNNVPLPNQTGVLWKEGRVTVKLGRFHNGLILVFLVDGNRLTVSRPLATWGTDYSRISGGGKWTADSESKLFYDEFTRKARTHLQAVQS